MNIKKIIKYFIPEIISQKYSEFKYLKQRVEFLEKEKKNRWLLEKIPNLKDQKHILRLNEFSVYSQNGEDGILNYIFSKIKNKNKTFIEFGVEDGKECNTANLSINFGWNGLLIEGDKKMALKTKEFYKDLPVKVVNQFVTKANINNIFKENGIVGEIDLLSIDIDGNDYWIWKEINAVNPRVVIVEYNCSFGEQNIVIPYSDSFNRFSKHPSGLYFGASLSSLTKLAKTKKYILIGCDSEGANAFFVRKDVARGKFKEISPKEAFYDSGLSKILGNVEKRFDIIKKMPFEKID